LGLRSGNWCSTLAALRDGNDNKKSYHGKGFKDHCVQVPEKLLMDRKVSVIRLYFVIRGQDFQLIPNPAEQEMNGFSS
jgi:hypothetical protein